MTAFLNIPKNARSDYDYLTNPPRLHCHGHVSEPKMIILKS